MLSKILPTLLLLFPLAGAGDTLAGATAKGARISAPPAAEGTDFTADAACVAAWDFRGASGFDDICDSGVNDDMVTTGGSAWTTTTFDSLDAYDTNGGYRETADSTDFDTIEGGDYALCCMNGIATGQTRVNFAYYADRDTYNDFGLLVDTTGTKGFQMGHNGGTYPVTDNGYETDDQWYVECVMGERIDANTDVYRYMIDAGITEDKSTFQGNTPDPSTGDFAVGCNSNGSACQEHMVRSCIIMSRIFTQTEACEYAAFGPEGNNWDRSSTITCE